MISIIFEFESPYGTFRDALNLPEDHGFSEEELTTMKQARLDNWITHIETASTTEPELVQEA